MPLPTGRQFLELVNEVMPDRLKTGLISKTMLRMVAPFHKLSEEMLGILYQWADPFVVDDSKFQRVFGTFETTPLDEAVRTTVDWYRTHSA
jgi:nucleoside-diphosphate-sugar epimerase